MSLPGEQPTPHRHSGGSTDVAALANGQVGSAARPAEGPSASRVPDFFIVGHQKCGTTALYEMLKGHPQIFLPDVKEPKYFISEGRSRAAQKAPAQRARMHTLDGYLSLFAAAGPEQTVGEASPQYLRSPIAAARIAEVQPAARIIAILREPVSFLRSFHLQMLGTNTEDQKEFRKAIVLEEGRRHGKRIPRHCQYPANLMYTEHVRYVEQLRRFEAQFSRENMLVLIYDDYRRDNEEAVRSVQRFLGVDETTQIELIETMPNQAVRFVALHQLAWAARHARRYPGNADLSARAVNALTPRVLRSDAVRARWRRVVYRAPRSLDEEFVQELSRRFKPEVVALSEYLDRDLVKLWGYDGI